MRYSKIVTLVCLPICAVPFYYLPWYSALPSAVGIFFVTGFLRLLLPYTPLQDTRELRQRLTNLLAQVERDITEQKQFTQMGRVRPPPLRARTKHPSDNEMQSFIELISKPLELQLGLAAKMLSGGQSSETSLTNPTPRALGYIYGWTDAFLRVRGWDMADTVIGMPVLFHVFRRLWPGHEDQLIDFLVDHLRDDVVMAGMMYGGQQYLDWSNQKLSPIGLAKCLWASQ